MFEEYFSEVGFHYRRYLFTKNNKFIKLIMFLTFTTTFITKYSYESEQ